MNFLCDFQTNNGTVRKLFIDLKKVFKVDSHFSDVSVPYQYRPFSDRHRNIIRCILNRTIRTYQAQWCQVLIRNWHVTDKCESTYSRRLQGWRWRQCFYPKSRYLPKNPHSVTTQKNSFDTINIFTAVRPSHLTRRCLIIIGFQLCLKYANRKAQEIS
jgi:hypothetical protein